MSVVTRLVSGSLLGMALAAPAVTQTVANGPYYATPAWDQKLQCDTLATCPRFVVLGNWNSEAVLDRETGVVWERQPNFFPFEQKQDWVGSFLACAQKQMGARKGWRLATVEELYSLIDGATNRLPTGHPFVGLQVGARDLYWSASRVPVFTDFAQAVGFGGSAGQPSITERHFYWCVRAPGGPVY